jgi:hypothetical protein
MEEPWAYFITFSSSPRVYCYRREAGHQLSVNSFHNCQSNTNIVSFASEHFGNRWMVENMSVENCVAVTIISAHHEAKFMHIL